MKTIFRLTVAEAQRSGFTVDDLRGRSRDIPIVEARCRIWAKAREAGISYPAIGEYFGRDHTTVHGCLKLRQIRSEK